MVKNLHDLLEKEILDLYSAEEQIIKALPKMAEAAESVELSDAFTLHLEQTEKQLQRLEQICEDLGFAMSKKRVCAGMKGIIDEGKEHMEMEMEDGLMDLMLIGSAQRVEHYEIAGYGTAKSYAETMGHDDAVSLLDKTLEEEKKTDEILTELGLTLQEEAPGMDEED
jgi:ferritin-like metal-binding protein YciE